MEAVRQWGRSILSPAITQVTKSCRQLFNGHGNGCPAPPSTSARKQRLNCVTPELHQHNWDQEPGLVHESSQGRFYVSVTPLWWAICDVSWGALFKNKLKTVSSFSGIAASLDQCSSCCPVPLHMGKKSWHENTSSHNRHYHNKLSPLSVCPRCCCVWEHTRRSQAAPGKMRVSHSWAAGSKAC